MLVAACGLLFYEIVPFFIEAKAESQGVTRLSPLFHLGRDLEPFQGWIIHGPEYSCDAVVKTIRVLELAGYSVNDGGDVLANTPLASAVMDNAPEVVRGLLKCGADINAKDIEGDLTALHLIFEGDDAPNDALAMEILRMLLQAGADVDALNHNGQTPLYSAIFNECSDGAVREFLRFHPDLTIRDNEGRSYLHLLAHSGYNLSDETLDLFIPQGGDIDPIDDDGNTPLAVAAMTFSESRVNYFLVRNAKTIFRDGKSILHRVIRIGTNRLGYYQGFFEFILSHPRVKSCIYSIDLGGLTPLHEAAHCASVKYILALLQAGASTSCKDVFGRTPLELARVCQDSPIVEVHPFGGIDTANDELMVLYYSNLKEVINILNSWEDEIGK